MTLTIPHTDVLRDVHHNRVTYVPGLHAWLVNGQDPGEGTCALLDELLAAGFLDCPSGQAGPVTQRRQPPADEVAW